MAILALTDSYKDLRERLGNIVVGWKKDKTPVLAKDINAVGSMMALLRDAIKPNLAQTVEGQPAIVHMGPFGVHFGVDFGSMLRPDSDSGLRPPQDQIFGRLGASLGPHVGPMLAPCWPHVGSCWASWAILAGSWNDFEPILRRF